MLVQDVMTRSPVTVGVSTSVTQAVTSLAEHRISTLPVVDRAGRVVGVVGETDLLRDAFRADPRTHLTLDRDASHPLATSVAEVMTSPAISVHRTTDVAEVVDLMSSQRFKSLPVVDDDDRIVGVVSRSDLVRARARGDATVRDEVAAVMGALGHGGWGVAVKDGVVDITGPDNGFDRSVAEVSAGTVTGVLRVSIHER
jgi:CBS domain-containing protein